MIMESSKNGRCIIPFKKFYMVRVKKVVKHDVQIQIIPDMK